MSAVCVVSKYSSVQQLQDARWKNSIEKRDVMMYYVPYSKYNAAYRHVQHEWTQS